MSICRLPFDPISPKIDAPPILQFTLSSAFVVPKCLLRSSATMTTSCSFASDDESLIVTDGFSCSLFCFSTVCIFSIVVDLSACVSALYLSCSELFGSSMHSSRSSCRVSRLMPAVQAICTADRKLRRISSCSTSNSRLESLRKLPRPGTA